MHMTLQAQLTCTVILTNNFEYRVVGIFMRDLLSHFLLVKSRLQKIKTANFFVVCVQGEQSVLLGTIYRAASRGVSGSMPLTAIAEAIQEIKVLWKYRCTNTTVAQV